MLDIKFYGSQIAFSELDEEIESKDQQAIEEWYKSFDIMKVIINISLGRFTRNYSNSICEKSCLDTCFYFELAKG